MMTRHRYQVGSCRAVEGALRALAALALVLFVTAPAFAGAGRLQGEGWLMSKNTAARQVMIGKDVYSLSPSATIRGLEGELLGLEDLIWVPEVKSFAKVPRVPSLRVRFDAVEVAGTLQLNWMELRDSAEGTDPSHEARTQRGKRARGPAAGGSGGGSPDEGGAAR